MFVHPAGPVKWTKQGFGFDDPGHVATELLMLQPGAEVAFTSTWTSLVAIVSTSTTMGAGCCTVTRLSVEVTVTLSFCAAPAFACAVSTMAVRLSGVTVAITSARPVMVTEVLLGGLMTTIWFWVVG